MISTLAERKQKAVIPYRNSALAKLLKNSLGGNSKTFIIATLSSKITEYSETLSTLRFAENAKKVKNQAFKNEEVEGNS